MLRTQLIERHHKKGIDNRLTLVHSKERINHHEHIQGQEAFYEQVIYSWKL